MEEGTTPHLSNGLRDSLGHGGFKTSGENHTICRAESENSDALHIFPLRPREMTEVGPYNLTTEKNTVTPRSSSSTTEDINGVDGNNRTTHESMEDMPDVDAEQTSTVNVFLDSYEGALSRKLRQHYSEVARKKREESKPAAFDMTRANAQITRLGSAHEAVVQMAPPEYGERRETPKTSSTVKWRLHKKDDKYVLKRHRSAGRQSSAGEKLTRPEVQTPTTGTAALNNWHRKVRLVIFCLRCVKQHCSGFAERRDVLPYLQTLQFLDYRADRISDLMFDPADFCPDRQLRIPEEAKRTLCKPRADRSEEEIYSAQLALRNIPSFAEFPARMQLHLAERGQYESYEARRVITRQGDPAVAFYLLLSGAVIAMEMDREGRTCTAVAEYVKGDCFEENPLLNDTARAYTVMSKENCEFLTISAKDYRGIFVQGGVKSLNDPDQESFLKSLQFLEGWPVHILHDRPSKCLFRYFTRGSILAKDTHRYSWIIVVKSGSVSVLKKLKKVGPYEWKKTAPLKPLTHKERRERKEKKRVWRRIILPELRLPLRRHREVDEIEERIDGRPKPFKHPDIKVHTNYEHEGHNSGHKEKVDKYYYPNLWTYKKETADDDNLEEGIFANINKQYLYCMTSTSGKESDEPNGHRGEDRSYGWTRAPVRHDSESSRIAEGTLSPTHSDSSMRSSVFSPTDMFSSTRSSSTSTFEERIHRILEEVERGLPDTQEELSDVDLDPQFVKVQTLVKGDVWGLADVLLDEDQASFTLVSNGADCVLLDRNLYLQHSPEKLQRKMKEELCPYPGDADLQSGLQVSVDWCQYRQRELDRTMHHVRCTRVMRDAVFEPKPQESS